MDMLDWEARTLNDFRSTCEKAIVSFGTDEVQYADGFLGRFKGEGHI